MACQTSSDKCGPCSFREIKEKVGILWCLVCKETLCTDCREHHAALKISRNHKLIPLENKDKLPVAVEKISETCFEHERKLEVFCFDHQEACCLKCSTTNHPKCNLSPLDEIIRDVKSSVAFNSIQDGVNVLFSKIDTLMEMKRNSVDIFKSQAIDIKKRIEDQRNGVVIKLQSLEEEISSQIDKLESNYCTETNEVLVKLDEQRRLLSQLKTDLLQIKENGTELQIFLCMKNFEAKQSQAEDRLTIMIEKNELDNHELSFIPDKELDILVSLPQIGEVKSLTKSIDLSFGSLGQSVKIKRVEHQTKRDMDKIKLEKKMEISLPQGCLVTNCVILACNAFLFTDFSNNKRLILFDGNGLHLRNIELESNPFDVTLMKETVVAVTLPEVKKVICIDLSSDTGTIAKHFMTTDKCYGIDFCMNQFAVSVKGYGIQLLNEKGVTLRTLFFNCTVLAFVKQHICYVETGQSALRCCNLYGEKQWEVQLPVVFKDYPSITIDNSGLIYVTERIKDNVFAVTSDGAGIYRKLLQQSDGLYNVNGVFFNVKTQQLLLCTKRDKSAVLYDLCE